MAQPCSRETLAGDNEGKWSRIYGIVRGRRRREEKRRGERRAIRVIAPLHCADTGEASLSYRTS